MVEGVGFDFDRVMQIQKQIHHAKVVVAVFAGGLDLQGQIDFGGGFDDHRLDYCTR